MKCVYTAVHMLTLIRSFVAVGTTLCRITSVLNGTSIKQIPCPFNGVQMFFDTKFDSSSPFIIHHKNKHVNNFHLSGEWIILARLLGVHLISFRFVSCARYELLIMRNWAPLCASSSSCEEHCFGCFHFNKRYNETIYVPVARFALVFMLRGLLTHAEFLFSIFPLPASIFASIWKQISSTEYINISFVQVAICEADVQCAIEWRYSQNVCQWRVDCLIYGITVLLAYCLVTCHLLWHYFVLIEMKYFWFRIVFSLRFNSLGKRGSSF